MKSKIPKLVHALISYLSYKLYQTNKKLIKARLGFIPNSRWPPGRAKVSCPGGVRRRPKRTELPLSMNTATPTSGVRSPLPAMILPLLESRHRPPLCRRALDSGHSRCSFNKPGVGSAGGCRTPNSG